MSARSILRMIGTRISYNTSLNTMTILGGKLFFLKRYHQYSTDPLHHTLMRSCEAQLQGKGAIPNTRFLNFILTGPAILR